MVRYETVVASRALLEALVVNSAQPSIAGTVEIRSGSSAKWSPPEMASERLR
jgi:hypothetical protein